MINNRQSPHCGRPNCYFIAGRYKPWGFQSCTRDSQWPSINTRSPSTRQVLGWTIQPPLENSTRLGGKARQTCQRHVKLLSKLSQGGSDETTSQKTHTHQLTLMKGPPLLLRPTTPITGQTLIAPPIKVQSQYPGLASNMPVPNCKGRP